MRAMIFTKVGKPLALQEVKQPKITPSQILLRVSACGVCRTDLHIIEGELKEPKLPLILGHQIVGRVEEVGESVKNSKIGSRMGVAWLQKTCMQCDDCKQGRENLCDNALFTGYQVDGGFAEYCAVEAHAAYPIPAGYDDFHAAPLFCAGLIGYRAYRMASKANKIGFYGFGSSAHILTQVVAKQGGEVYAFTRDEDKEAQEFAKSLGAVWAGGVSEKPPSPLDAAIIFAPVGALVVDALKIVKKGGIVVCAGIYMSDIPSFPYSFLWNERKIASVANVTRKDAEEFIQLASKIKIDTNITTYPLEEANRALQDLKEGKVSGSIVLEII